MTDEQKTTVKDLEISYDSPNWCPGCILPSTRIQTNPSSKIVTEIKQNSKVLGSDGKPHEVTEVMQHIHTGDMYTLQSKYFGQTTLTPEHPVLAVRRVNQHNNNLEWNSEWIEAAELKKGDYLLYPVLKETRDVEKISLEFSKKKKDTRSKKLPKEILLSPEFLRLAGYYIAEGYVHPRSICFTFHQEEKAFVDDVDAIIRNIFHIETKRTLRKDKHTLDISCNSSYLAEMFSEWFGKGEAQKNIPDFLMFLPKEKQTELIKGLWRGDGWISKTTHRASFKTISKILSEQLKMLLLRQGILPIITTYKAYGIHKESFTIQIQDAYDFSVLQQIMGNFADTLQKIRTRPLLTADFAFLPIKRITTQPYHGPVHNFEVDTENAYVTENAILHNCGDFGIWVSVKNAIVQLGLKPWEVVLVSGIGCSSKLPYWVKTYGFNGLHGRPIPPAEAIKLANHGLTVIVIAGDGDQFGEGMSHWIHAARRNSNITLLVHDNQIYGLTTGQFSPRTDMGDKNKVSTMPLTEEPVNPMSMALTAGATFIARGFAGDTKLETKLIVEGVKHQGFSIIDSMQPCVTFNHKNTYSWFYERIYDVQTENHDTHNRTAAFAKAEEWPNRRLLTEGEKERIPVGILYQEDRPTWEEVLPQIKETPLVKQSIENIDINPLLDEMM